MQDQEQIPTPLPTDRRAMLAGIGGLAAGALLAGKAHAGPLTPPPGPITPTPGPEPRIPIGPSTTPGDAGATFRVTQPGSYYLPANLVGEPGKGGIAILVSGVHLDLMGFDLSGGSGPTSAVVAIGTELSNITIINGSVRNWAVGISLSPSRVISGRIQGIHAFGCNLVGIQAGNGCTVMECTATSNTIDGIRTGSDCTVTNSIAKANGNYGISSASDTLIDRCIITGNGSGVFIGSGTMISNCQIQFNRGVGIFGGSDNRITNNKILDNRNTSGVGQGIGVTGQGNFIDGNNIILQAPGIIALEANNIIVRNSIRAAEPAFDLASGNILAPTVTGTNIANSGNPHANYLY